MDRSRRRADRRGRRAARTGRGGPARGAPAPRNGDDELDTASRVIDELGLQGFTDAATLAGRYGEPPNTNGADTVDGAAHVRARARRRSAGPHRDAVAHARPPLPVGIDDARGRPRSGQPARRGRVVGRRARAPAPAQRRPLRHAHDQLPHARRRSWTSRRGLLAVAAPDGRAVAFGPQHRRAARASSDARRIASSTRRAGARRAALEHAPARSRSSRPPRCTPRSSPRSPTSARRATPAKRSTPPIAVLEPAERQGPRVRPRRGRRARRARDTPIAPASACSTSRSPARRRPSPSCTPSAPRRPPPRRDYNQAKHCEQYDETSLDTSENV